MMGGISLESLQYCIITFELSSWFILNYKYDEHCGLTCSRIGAVVGLTISFCTTANLTTLGDCVSSFLAVKEYPLSSKLPSPANSWVSFENSNRLTS